MWKSSSEMPINPRVIFTLMCQRWSWRSTTSSFFLALLVWTSNTYIHITYILTYVHTWQLLPFSLARQKYTLVFSFIKVLLLSSENRGGSKLVSIDLTNSLKTCMLLSWWCPFGAGKELLPTRQFIKIDRLIQVSTHLCFHLTVPLNFGFELLHV